MLIGNYILGQQIGKGNDSSCYLVKKEEELYCLKLVTLVAESEDGKKERIEREIEILKILNANENVIKLEESFILKNNYLERICVITEMMQMDLSKYIEAFKGKLTEKRGRKISQQLMDGINYCHQLMVVHQDIKMENITIDAQSGKIKIIDFGMSCIATSEEEISNMKESKGTPLYICPQKCTRSEYDGRKSDVWSCGILIYRMLTGIFPFGEGCKTLKELCCSIVYDDFPISTKFSSPLISFLNNILSKNEEQRFFAFEALQHPWLKDSQEVVEQKD